MPGLEHVVVIGDPAAVGGRGRQDDDLGRPAAGRRVPARRRVAPVGPGHLRLHRRHHRAVQGLHAQPQLPRRPRPSRSAICGGAPPTTSCGRRCRCSTSTRSVTAVLGPLVFGGRAAIYRRFSVSNFWPEMNRVGATMTSTLGTMAYLLAHDEDRPEMPLSGAPEANTSLRLLGAAPLPVEVDAHHQGALRHRHVQRRLRRHRGEPDLVAAAGRREQAERGRRRQRRVLRRPHLRRRRQRAAGAAPTARS